MKSILDPSFRYTKSVETDLRKTFARARREIRRQQQEQAAAVDGAAKVLPFNSRNTIIARLPLRARSSTSCSASRQGEIQWTRARVR